MEKIKKFSILQNLSCITLCMYFILMALFPLISCSDSDMLIADKQQNAPETYTYELHLNIDKPTFEGEHTRGTTDWKDGSVVDLYFYTNESKTYHPGTHVIDYIMYHGIQGTATYNSNLNIWYLETTKEFPSERNLSNCEVRYYYPPNSTNSYLKAVYYGTTTYTIKDEVIRCKSTCLEPVNSRLRFHGKPDTHLTLDIMSISHSSGEKLRKDLNIGGGLIVLNLTEEFEAMSLSVESDGYTPYIYGNIEDCSAIITVETGGKTYCRAISKELLKVGESAYLEIPTESNYISEGWSIIHEDSKSFTVRGVTFKMNRVEAGQYILTAIDQNGEYNHDITLSKDFYISETEITNELWRAVMGSTPNIGALYTYSTSDYPVRNVSWQDCQAFIDSLNELTSMHFRLPTIAEWLYAARGGNKSRGYRYSGSNILDDVAWTSDIYNVGNRMKNELGLCDMSGNVKEWCQDNDYPNFWTNSNAYTDPIVVGDNYQPNPGYHERLGGGAGSIADYCRAVLFTGNYYQSAYELHKDLNTGFRITF